VTTLELHQKFLKDPNLTSIVVPGSSYSTIQFIVDHPLWQDKRVRQAIAYGIDKERAIREYLGEQGSLAWSPIPPIRGWAHNPNIKPYPYDPEKAMKLLNEAGWKLDSKGVLRNAKGQAFEFELGTFVGVERASMNVIFQENLRKLGINAKVATRASAEQMYIMYDAKGPDVTFINWGMTLDVDVEMWRRYHSSEEYNNYFNWKNKRADELLELGRKEQDQSKRQKYYWELQELIHEELPGLVVFWRNSAYAFRKEVKGYVLDAGSGWLSYIHLVSLEK
ncbi:MAG: ABC transporter substrate-binding protein, partial [Bacillota bacterium]|nr:ABC transporter substrate-binding protein [Bacillota bacterium]